MEKSLEAELRVGEGEEKHTPSTKSLQRNWMEDADGGPLTHRVGVQAIPLLLFKGKGAPKAVLGNT